MTLRDGVRESLARDNWALRKRELLRRGVVVGWAVMYSAVGEGEGGALTKKTGDGVWDGNWRSSGRVRRYVRTTLEASSEERSGVWPSPCLASASVRESGLEMVRASATWALLGLPRVVVACIHHYLRVGELGT